MPRTLKVLVADDDPANLLLASEVLQMFGAIVVVVTNGQEAVTAFKQERFDMVFMDSLMPSMNGVQATAEIRQHEANIVASHTPIIAFTASAYPADIKLLLDAGMDDVLLKPFKIDDMNAALLRWT